MINGGFYAESSESSNAANTQNDLLPEPHLPIIFVKPGGQIAVFGGIFSDIGIEQVKGHSPYRDTPYLNLDGVASD
jgi:hypothetical protein